MPCSQSWATCRTAKNCEIPGTSRQAKDHISSQRPPSFTTSGLPDDVNQRQGLLKLRDAFGGDLGLLDVELLEVGELGEVGQAGVGDLGGGEVERVQLGEAGEVREAGVGDLGFVEAEALEVFQPGEVDEAGVAEGRVVDVEPDERRAVRRAGASCAVVECLAGFSGRGRRPRPERREPGASAASWGGHRLPCTQLLQPGHRRLLPLGFVPLLDDVAAGDDRQAASAQSAAIAGGTGTSGRETGSHKTVLTPTRRASEGVA